MSQSKPSRLSIPGLHFIRAWEGCNLHPYRDVVGNWTIGIGHLITATEERSGMIGIDGRFVSWRDGISQQEAFALLDKDADSSEACILDIITAPLSQEQFDALVSWAFNVGNGAARRSTLRRRLNNGEYDAVPAELIRWNKADGRVIHGLSERREAEGKLFARGIYTGPGPGRPIIEPQHLVSLGLEENDMMGNDTVDTKPALFSKTVIGSTAVIVSTALTFAGIPIGPEAVGELMNHVIAFGGGLLALYGRFKASTEIKGIVSRSI